MRVPFGDFEEAVQEDVPACWFYDIVLKEALNPCQDRW